MHSNFSTLPAEWQRLARTSIEAEQQVNTAPQYAMPQKHGGVDTLYVRARW
jgi:hypothetical protein